MKVITRRRDLTLFEFTPFPSFFFSPWFSHSGLIPLITRAPQAIELPRGIVLFFVSAPFFP